MAQFSDSSKLNKSFWHFLSKAILNSWQAPYESNYKSAHSVTKKDVWTDIVPYAVWTTTADDNATNNPDIIKKYDLVDLTEVPWSNWQARYLDDWWDFVRPFISPVDVPAAWSNEPSYWYEVKIYKDNWDRIYPTTWKWNVWYYESIIYFDVWSTPDDLWYWTPKIDVYVYVWETLADSLIAWWWWWWSTIVDTITLTATDETNKYITLSDIPAKPEFTIMLIQEAWNQAYNDDYYVDSDLLKWDWKAIDWIITEWDTVTITYNN